MAEVALTSNPASSMLRHRIITCGSERTGFGSIKARRSTSRALLPTRFLSRLRGLTVRLRLGWFSPAWVTMAPPACDPSLSMAVWPSSKTLPKPHMRRCPTPRSPPSGKPVSVPPGDRGASGQTLLDAGRACQALINGARRYIRHRSETHTFSSLWKVTETALGALGPGFLFVMPRRSPLSSRRRSRKS